MKSRSPPPPALFVHATAAEAAALERCARDLGVDVWDALALACSMARQAGSGRRARVGTSRDPRPGPLAEALLLASLGPVSAADPEADAMPADGPWGRDAGEGPLVASVSGAALAELSEADPVDPAAALRLGVRLLDCACAAAACGLSFVVRDEEGWKAIVPEETRPTAR